MSGPSQLAKKKEAEKEGWSRKKTVHTGCSQMREINRALSGGGAKVSAATVSQAWDPAADPMPVCWAATVRL